MLIGGVCVLYVVHLLEIMGASLSSDWLMHLDSQLFQFFTAP